MSENPVWRENTTKANQKMIQTPEWKEANKKAIAKIMADPDYEEKCKERGKVLSSNQVWKENHDVAMKERANDPKWKLWRIEENKRMAQDPHLVEKRLIVFTGEGFWYGNKILQKDRNYYCELWNRDLWDRIDAAYDFKSILSGKTKFDNNGISLTHHHLYWQPKACCVWDEDANGYYAWIINNGERIKYYINGDPNKFVLLTVKEHGIIKGKKGTNKDRIYYIKLMEGLIEQRAKEGKKCYLSPEEYEVYKVEHADIIKKYTM
jgi:post-segregation antitoxin (ccd killing protein)